MAITHLVGRGYVGVVAGIDFGIDGRLPLTLFARRVGVNLSTVYRWSQRGARGVAPLQMLRIGGRTYVTADAWREFDTAINAA